MHILINKKNLSFGNYKVKCAIGKRGIRHKFREGDNITPIGQYKIMFILYRKDRIKKLQTKLKKIEIKKDMGWCNDPKSKKYNQLVKIPNNFKYEKLFKKERIYDLILVLDYNMKPIRKNKGSAIFIHIAKKNYQKTQGCVALRKKHLIKIIKEIKRSTKVKIVDQK